MPSRVTIITLSELERNTSAAAGAAAAAKQVGDEVARQLKAGDDHIRALANAKELDPEQLGAAVNALNKKKAILDTLPIGEARTSLLGDVDKALGIATEALEMLGQHPGWDA